MKNKSIVKRSLKSVWHPCSQMKHYEKQLLIPIAKGRGSWLIDFEGKKYLDATSSWWVNLSESSRWRGWGSSWDGPRCPRV